MQKYKHNRTLIIIICDQCGKEYSKPVSEYKRNQKLGDIIFVLVLVLENIIVVIVLKKCLNILNLKRIYSIY